LGGCRGLWRKKRFEWGRLEGGITRGGEAPHGIRGQLDLKGCVKEEKTGVNLKLGRKKTQIRATVRVQL